MLIGVCMMNFLWLISSFWGLITLAVTIGSVTVVAIHRYRRGIRTLGGEHGPGGKRRAMEPGVLSVNAYASHRWPALEFDSRATKWTAQRRRNREEVVMFTCIICCFVVEFDDVISRFGSRRCVCLRCFARETGSERPMPQALRRQVIQVLAENHVA